MKVQVWDGFIRGFHWLLLVTFAGLWYTGGNIDFIDQHELLGLFMLALLLTRIMWGFVGSESARFSTFVKGPVSVWRYLRDKSATTPLTHNPIGAWSVIALLTLLLAQALTGLFTDDAIFYQGPLASWVDNDVNRLLTRYHKQIIDGILILVAIHIVAIFVYRIRGTALTWTMVSGKRQTSEPLAQPKLVHGAWGYGLLAVNCLWIYLWLG
ncbi:MAG: cytochrome b/b6 domain-containing protein [Idiomarina sp.]|nr:cytochrome b/b6 domain-containing protein [Idiomarina sp.]